MSSPPPSSSAFEVREHVINAQHIREYPRATASSQDEVLQLAVKQYIPKNNPSPQPGDVTILASPANGFPKVYLHSAGPGYGLPPDYKCLI